MVNNNLKDIGAMFYQFFGLLLAVSLLVKYDTLVDIVFAIGLTIPLGMFGLYVYLVYKYEK